MKKSFEQISLRKKMLIMFGSMIFLVILIVGITLYQYYGKIFRKNYQELFGMTITSVTYMVKEQISETINSINLLNDNSSSYINQNGNNLSDIASFVCETNVEDTEMDIKDISSGIRQYRTQLDILFKSASVHGLIVPQKYPISKYFDSYYRLECNFYRDTLIAREKWYQIALEKNGEIYWFVNEKYPDKLFLAKRLIYRDSNNSIAYELSDLGVICLGITVPDFSEMLSDYQLSEEIQLFFMNDQGDVLAAKDQEKAYLAKEIFDNSDRFTSGETYFEEYGNEEYLIQTNVLDSGISMLAFIPMEKINEFSSQMLAMLLVLLVCAFVIAVVLVDIMSGSITKPVVHLANIMRLGEVKPVDVNDFTTKEIAILYQGYNQMQNEIIKMLQNVKDSEEKKKKAELRFLQAQINPHFIYNSMSKIGGLALLSGQDTIAKQLNRLAAIMRYNTQNPDSLIPLKNEIQMIHQYVEISQMGVKNNVILSCQIAEECENILIPKLLIQPLVENSLIHGIDCNQEGGKIEILTEIDQNGYFIVIVRDNGIGGDIQKINDYIQGKSIIQGEHESVGVRNVFERIKGVYGDDGTLEYRMDYEQKMEAVITIKMIAKAGGQI